MQLLKLCYPNIPPPVLSYLIFLPRDDGRGAIGVPLLNLSGEEVAAQSNEDAPRRRAARVPAGRRRQGRRRQDHQAPRLRPRSPRDRPVLGCVRPQQASPP